jgi:hypothetical protein
MSRSTRTTRGPCPTSAARPSRSALGLGLDWPLGTAESVWTGEKPWRGRLGEAGDRAVPGRWGRRPAHRQGTASQQWAPWSSGPPAPSCCCTCPRNAYLAGHAMRQAITTRPADLARTIAWDRGKRNGLPHGLHHRHRHPGMLLPAHKPWQRGSNENTNGLLHKKVLVAAHPGPARNQSTVADPGGVLRALSDPHLVEQRAGVIRGLLAVAGPGGDEPSR